MDLLAQSFGTVTPPGGVAQDIGGITRLVSALVKTLMVGAAVYAVFNIVLAGYAYISAGGDPKGIQIATAKIWQSVVGVAVAVGALAIAGIASQIIFGNPNQLVDIQLFAI